MLWVEQRLALVAAAALRGVEPSYLPSAMASSAAAEVDEYEQCDDPPAFGPHLLQRDFSQIQVKLLCNACRRISNSNPQQVQEFQTK